MSNCKIPGANLSSVERDPVFLSQKGKPGGVATLDANGKIPLAQIDIKTIFTERDPIYLADRGAPFGCATLDGLSHIPPGQLGSGTADGTTTLFGDGTWRVPPTSGAFQGSFTAAMWAAGVTNKVTIIRVGVPSPGQIGPHNLITRPTYLVQVYRISGSTTKLVDTGVEIDLITGNITLTKTGRAVAFDGYVIVSSI